MATAVEGPAVAFQASSGSATHEAVTMKAQYVGDVGDFGKLLLLKCLAACGFKIGVNWMMTQNDDGSDGVHRNYIGYRGVDCLCCCDTRLLAGIAPLARKPKERRSIEDLEALIKTFSPDSVFYKGYFDDFSKRKIRNEEAYEKLNGASIDLIFFDPDNGLSDGPPVSSKHVYLSDLKRCWDEGKSLLVYHHLPQRQFAERAISSWIEELGKLTGNSVTHFRFRRGTGRVYFLCTQRNHASRLCKSNGDLMLDPLLATKANWARSQRLKRKICTKNHEWHS